MVTGLENLRSLVHENFLPALDRCSIILSRLRGLARFYDSLEDIGFSATLMTKILDIVASMNLVGHRVLLLIMDELEHFSAFSFWLRGQIDRLASSNADTEELMEREASVDHDKVLTYIEDYLVDSPLRIFFADMDKVERDMDLQYVEDGRALLDVLTAQLEIYENGGQGMKALTRVEFLVDYASKCSSHLFQNIAEAMRRSVRFGKSIRLSIGRPIDIADGHMCPGPDKASSELSECLLLDPPGVTEWKADSTVQ